MKSLIVRLAVAALALTGFAASTVISHQSKTAVNPIVASSTPVPMCLPGQGVCGLQ